MNIDIPATDGVVLTGRIYEPPTSAVDTVLALPGIGVPQRVFRHIGPWLAERGVRTISIDYRGMWGSGGRDGERTASLTTWAQRDAVGALRRAEALAGEPVSILAHSFAGQMLGFHDAFRRARAVATIGSGFGQPVHFAGATRAWVTASWYVTLPVAAALASRIPPWLGIGESLPRGVGREWAKWGRSKDWLLTHVPGARERYARYDRPILALRATDDRIAPRRASRALLRELRAAPVTYEEVSPDQAGTKRLDHAGLFRPAAAVVWPRILAHFRQPEISCGVTRPVVLFSTQSP